MSTETPKDLDFNEAVKVFKANDAELVSLVDRIKKFYETTPLVENKEKIDKFREAILVQDITNQVTKLQMFNDLLNDLEK